MITNVAKERQGIQSIEVGFRLLHVLCEAKHPMMLRDLAAASGMPAAKAHRYLVSFMRTGLVEQNPATGRYDLGSYALELGLSSLGRLDPVRLAAPILDDLCEEIQESVALAVWGNHGPTIVRIVDAGGPIAITMRTGALMSLTRSATGRVFAAFYRSPMMRQMVSEEIQEAATARKVAVTTIRRQLENTLADIRSRGISRASGAVNPGINGFSVPVYDHTGAMIAAITSLGPLGEFDESWDSPIAEATRAAGRKLSARLGYGVMSDANDTAPAAAESRRKKTIK